MILFYFISMIKLFFSHEFYFFCDSPPYPRGGRQGVRGREWEAGSGWLCGAELLAGVKPQYMHIKANCFPIVYKNVSI